MTSPRGHRNTVAAARPRRDRVRAPVVIALAYATVLVVILTAPLGEPHPPRPFLLEFVGASARRLLADAVVNVALFAPLGWLVHRVGRRVGLTVPGAIAIAAVACLAFSFAVEALQYLLAYRYSSIVDVATNTAGGVAGAWVERAVARA